VTGSLGQKARGFAQQVKVEARQLLLGMRRDTEWVGKVIFEEACGQVRQTRRLQTIRNVQLYKDKFVFQQWRMRVISRHWESALSLGAGWKSTNPGSQGLRAPAHRKWSWILGLSWASGSEGHP
jgi:hypothetical protein